MRISRFACITLAGVIVYLSACNRSLVNLEYTNAKEEVPQLGNLVFRFSQPLVKDSLLNRWDSVEYISFEPKIPGRFRWESPDELVFSPARPLLPATTYKAKLKDDILQYSKYNGIAKAEKITFHTPNLKLEGTNVSWVLPDEQSKTALPQIDLYFNYPVNLEQLKEKLQLSVEGQKADYTAITASNDSKVSLRLNSLKPEDKDYETIIRIDKGLKPEGGTNSTDDVIENKTGIPSPYVLQINDVQSEHDGSTGILYVKTSQQILNERLSSYIKFDPAIKFSVEPTDDGFMISSENFDIEKSYDLTVSKGLRGRIGGVLHEDFFNQVAFGKLEPSVSFTNSKSVYLSSEGARNIQLKIVNVPKVKIVVSKIYENNILLAQRYGYSPVEKVQTRRVNDEEGEDESDRDYYYDQGGDATLGDVIYEKEIDTRTLPKYGATRLFNFNLEDRLSDFKGIYHIRVRSTDDYWISDNRFISLSDIGLIAKEGRDKIFVFANSIKTANPLKEVNVIAYGANNQVLGIGNTNSDGVAEIQYTRKEFAGFKPAMLIAKTAGDFTYLPFGSTRVNTSRFEVEGKRLNSTGLDAFIYGERDIYRPGEQVNFSVIVRDQQWKSPGELPIILKFLLPNGKELKTFRKNLNAQGSIEGSVPISQAAITGSYVLEVYSSNEILLGTKNFSVEEFVPDRIKVTSKLNKEFLQPGEKTMLNINAVNFFGPPAAYRNYECEIQLKQKGFNVKKYDRYSFSLTNQTSFHDNVTREGKTDAAGNATESFEVPAMYKNMGVLQANFYTTVFDETGRPVSRLTSADIFTQQVFFGISDDGYWYYALNQPVKFPVIAVDRNGNPVTAQAKAEVIRHEYRTVLTKNGDYFRYESQKEDLVVSTQMINVNGENSFYSYVPRTPGDYEVRISLPGANSYVSRDFWSYGWWGGEASSFEVNTEGNIDIESDKSSYLNGEIAKLLFKAPFDGRMLITIENEKVNSYQYVNVVNRSASLDIKLNGEHLPNVYVTATLIKPHDGSEIPLTVAHGFQNLKVEEKSRKMGVEIIADKSVRSKTHQKISVKAEANSYVTLAAVDNGVLQITDFSTPDPYAYFYAKRALEVNAYDMYPLLFPEVRPRLSSTGGDGSDMQKRVNPMPAKRFKIVSYWSGIQQTNGSGEANFEIDIPQFSGQVRLMAVAYKNENFGSAESAMTVADPIVISTALPRFLAPGDTVTVPLTLSNTTNKSSDATATMNVSGALRVAGANKQTVSLEPNSETQARFQLVAAPAVGIGNVNVQVQAMGEQFTDETEISVRPASSLQKITGSGSLGANSNRISIATNDFIQGSVDYQLVISKSPALELGKQLQYLVQYPYGCTEQTVSSAFPQLYFSDLADLVQLKGYKAASLANVQEAIKKIKLRQLYNGAITLWDGEGEAHWWASVYAAHFLWEAKRAGFDVDDQTLQSLFTYLINRLRNKETINYYYNQNQQKKIAPKEVAYSLYVLAMVGKQQISSMNYYKSNPQLLSLDSRYLLSAAYAIAGDKKQFLELLPTSFSGEESIPQTGGSFYSDIRDEAIALNALLDVDPTNSQIPVMAKHVSDKLKQRYWYSTQEAAFGFLGLGKLARAGNKSTVTADVKVNGRTITNFSGASLKLNMKQLGGNNIEVVTRGEGQLFYFWESEGISSTGSVKEEDNYLRVRRQFYDRNGNPISGNTFKQNDLIIVRVALEKSYSGDVDNIVITDMLPAGFEIENARTKEIPGMDWIKDGSTPTAIDVRDDRINLFVDLNRPRQVYYYAVRAVSPGIYHMGPISADAMYNGEYHSYNGAGMVTVTGNR